MKFRVSSLPSLRACPGYAALLRTVPESGNKNTSRGTLGHKALECHADGQPLPEMEDELAREVQAAIEWIEAQDLGKPVGVEAEVRCEVAGHNLVGHVDRSYFLDDGVIVIDWKFSNDPDGMVPIGQDLQMRGYGQCYKKTGQNVYVMRVIINSNGMQPEVLALDTPSAWEQNESILADVVSRAVVDGQRYPGIHCQRCLIRQHCPEYLDGAHQLVPMRLMDGELTTNDATKLMLAVMAGEDLCAAARRVLESHVRGGGVIAHGGKQFTLSYSRPEKIVSHPEVINALASELGEPAVHALRTSKSGIADAFWRAGRTPEDAEAFIEKLKTRKLIVKGSSSEVFRWKKERTKVRTKPVEKKKKSITGQLT